MSQEYLDSLKCPSEGATLKLKIVPLAEAKAPKEEATRSERPLIVFL
jgi:hypothetical protein